MSGPASHIDGHAGNVPPERRQYALHAAMYHLIRAGMWDELAQLFATPDFVIERSGQFGFADVYNDALAAARANEMSPEWREAFTAWEFFLRRRIERLRSVPQAYSQEVVNEFLPAAPEILAARFSPLREQLRGTSGPYLRKLSGPPALGAVQTGVVYGLAFSPDQRLAVCGSDDRTVKVWDIQTGQLQAECVGHADIVRCVAFSPDGRLVASGGHDRTVRVWEADSGRLIATCAGHRGWVTTAAFSADGHWVASADTGVMIWEADTGNLVAAMAPHDSLVLDLAFSTDGLLVASASQDGTVRVCETQTGALVARCSGHAGWATSVRFLADGTRLVSGGNDGALGLWDARSGELTAECAAGDSVTGVAVSPGGELIASAAGTAAVKLWAAASGRLISEYTGHGEAILAVSFPADDTLAANSVSALYTAPALVSRLAEVEQEQQIRVWDTESARLLAGCSGLPGRPIGLMFSGNGSTLLAASDENAVRAWRMPSGQLAGDCRGLSGPLADVTVNTDGGLVAAASSDGEVMTWTMPPVDPGQPCPGLGAAATCIEVSPDGALVAAGSDAGVIVVWQARTGCEVCRCVGHDGAVVDVAFAPDGQTFASAGKDATVRHWRADTGELVQSWKNSDIHDVWSVDFDSSGITVHCALDRAGQFVLTKAVYGGDQYDLTAETKMPSFPGHAATSQDLKLTAASDRLLDRWTARRQVRLPVDENRANAIRAVAFSPDGELVAWGLREVVVRERATGREFPPCAGHENNVTSIAFSPDGRFLATASDDHTVRAWEAATGLCLANYPDIGPSPTVLFSPDGSALAVGTADGTVRVWDAQTGEQLFEDATTMSYVSDLAFSPDGRVVVASGSIIRNWDIQTGQVVGGLPRRGDGDDAFKAQGLIVGVFEFTVSPVNLGPLRMPSRGPER